MEPAFDAFASQYGQGRAQLLYTRLVADMETPVSAYLKLGFESSGAARDNAFLLESVQGGETRGRYSIIGLKPDLIWRCRGGQAEINRAALNDREAFVAEPAKPLAGYLMGIGHFGAGAITFVTAEVLKLTFVEQLFQLNRKKLLSIPAFALGYQYWRQMMDLMGSMEVWKMSRRLAENAAHLLRTRWLQVKRVHHLQFRLYDK